MLKLNESTVRKRVAALKEKGVIKKFTVIVDPSKIGFNTIAIVGIDVDPSKLLDAAQKLSEIPETKYVATSTRRSHDYDGNLDKRRKRTIKSHFKKKSEQLKA